MIENVSYIAERINKQKMYVLFIVFVAGCIHQGLGAGLLLLISPFYISSRSFFKDFRKNRIIRIVVYLCFASAIFSLYFGFSRPIVYFQEIIKQLSWIVLALLGVRLTEREMNLFYRLFIISIVLCLPLVFISTYRFHAYFQHANHLAYFSLFPFFHFLLTKYKRNQWFFLFLTVCIIILTESSGGLSVIFILVLVYYFTQKKIGFKVLVSLSMAVVGIFIIAYASGVFTVLYEKIAVVDFDNIVAKADRLSFGMEGSFVWRMTYWLALINEFLTTSSTYELLFGKGLKTMSPDYYIYYFMRRDPHNDYVRLLLERGFIGGSVYLVLLIQMCLKNKYCILLLTMLLLPMASGNIIINFPYMFSFIILTSMLATKNKIYYND